MAAGLTKQQAMDSLVRMNDAHLNKDDIICMMCD